MKITKINNTDYQIYLFSNGFKSQEEIKDLIYSLRDRLYLRGFYKVIVCIKKIGIFIELIKKENSYYKRVLDLKIVFEENKKVYFKTEDYFLIKDMDNIKYLDNYYYVLVDNNFSNILEKIEFGEFVFEKQIVW